MLTLPAQMSFRGFGMSYQIPLVRKWNVAIQRELPWATALEIAYVGNSQVKQNLQHTAYAAANIGTTDPEITAESRRLIPYIGSGTITDSFGYGNYHSLATKLEKRLCDGVEFITSYTWGHAMSNANTPLSGGTGADFRDIDNDGYPDMVFVALDNETFPLFRNTGMADFTDVTARSLSMAGYSPTVSDFDNDGWKDLFVT